MHKICVAFIFVLFAQDLAFARDTNSCALRSADIVNSGFANEFIQEIQLNELKRNPSEFCDSNLGVRFLLANRVSPGDNWKVQVRQLMLKKDASVGGDSKDSSSMSLGMGMNSATGTQSGVASIPFSNWDLSLIPLEEAREKVSNRIDFPGLKQGFGWKGALALDEAVSALNRERCDFPAPLEGARDILSGRKNVNLPLKSVATTYACAELLGIAKSLNCSKSFATVERIAAPTGSGITGVEIYSKVLQDSRYDEGLRLAALKLAERVKNNSEASSNFFDDLKTSFKESGADDEAAEEMTWNAVALIATGGPNLSWRLQGFPASKDQQQKRLALTTMANVLPLLDHRSSSKGQLYSLPKGVSGACNNGKAYHFWYSAYLSRRASLESGDIEGSAAAAFQAEKFYHITGRSGSQNKGNSNVMATSPTFSPASNVVREDLAYAAVGAKFGALRAANQTLQNLSIDNTVSKLLSSGGKGDTGIAGSIAGVVGGSLGSTYKQWNQKFNANVAFESSYLNQRNLKISQLSSFEKTPKLNPCP